MMQYIPYIVVGIIATIAGYYGDYLPDQADSLIEQIPGLPAKESEINELNPSPPRSQSGTNETDTDTEIIEDDKSIEELQQEIIEDTTATNKRQIFGKITEVRDCKTDIDCLESYPDAGLSIQCNKQNGECFKFV